VRALQQTGVRRVVQLSSWGAEHDHGTGNILAPHDAEQILAEVPGLALTHLRPVTFYTNYYGFLGLGMIRSACFLGANCPGNYRSALVHPVDIAAAAAEELTTRPAPCAMWLATSEPPTKSRTC
jgi:uncharacterized protein YbjT (DUF2867 family)